MATNIFFRQELREYDFGTGHPFHADRFERFIGYLKDNVTEKDHFPIVKAGPASDDDLSIICRKEYIEFTQGYYRAANLGLSFPGQFLKFQSEDNRPLGKPGKIEEAARLIVGQAKMACDLVEQNKVNKTVSIGGGLHHAKSYYGEGFCLYNDVAFCGLYLIKNHRLERIMILDTDAHAGNGTSEYFYEEPRVLFIDLHQDPRTIYPGTGFAHEVGRGQGKGFTVNIPLPVGAGDTSYRLVFENIVQPLAEEFQPQIIIRNGGSDPHFADGLASLGLTVKGFRMIGEKVSQMAEMSSGRVIDLIASGYNDTALLPCWLALIAGLDNLDIEIKEPNSITHRLETENTLEETKKVVDDVKKNLREYWKSLR